MKPLLLLALFISACDDPAGGDAEQPRLDDLEAGLRASNRAVGLSSAFIGTGVVDARAPADTIALAIYQHVKAQTGTCAQAMPTGPTVSLDLGSGCTLASAGFVVGGTAELTVSPSPAPLTLHFDYQINADGQPVTGTLDGNTLDGNAYTYATQATTGGATCMLPFFTAGIAGGGAQVNGMGTLSGKKSSMIDVMAVHQDFAGCYPDEGTVRVRDSGTDFTVTFDSNTPHTGEVSVTQGGAARTATLPRRSGCPR